MFYDVVVDGAIVTDLRTVAGRDFVLRPSLAVRPVPTGLGLASALLGAGLVASVALGRAGTGVAIVGVGALVLGASWAVQEVRRAIRARTRGELRVGQTDVRTADGSMPLTDLDVQGHPAVALVRTRAAFQAAEPGVRRLAEWLSVVGTEELRYQDFEGHELAGAEPEDELDCVYVELPGEVWCGRGARSIAVGRRLEGADVVAVRAEAVDARGEPTTDLDGEVFLVPLLEPGAFERLP
ncbi:MAG: hypothetical protein R3F61_23510 [Myxococcota bacterium]